MSINIIFTKKIIICFEFLESVSPIFYFLVLIILLGIRLELITTTTQIIDFIITVNLIPLGSFILKKLRGKDNNLKPHIPCMKCSAKIESTGKWECKNIVDGKKCGWIAIFPKN